MKPPYSIEVATKTYSVEYKVPKFQKFDYKKGTIREHAVRFLDSIGAHVHDADLCVREFYKSLSNRV